MAADIAAGVATDAAGNLSTAARFSRTYDSTAPTVILSSAAIDPTDQSSIPVTVTFSEPVTGFTAGDLIVVNGAIEAFSGGGASYTFSLIPASRGPVTVNIAAGAAQDGAGNSNAAAVTFNRTYAVTATIWLPIVAK